MKEFRVFVDAEYNLGSPINLIGDMPEYYKSSENNGKLTLSAKIHMELDNIGIPKKNHYFYISNIVQREIKSVKELSVVEGKAFIKYLKARQYGEA